MGYEHFDDDRTVDRGVPSFNGEPLKLDESTFIGSPDDSYATAEVDALNARITHDFSDNVTLVNQTRFADYEKFCRTSFRRPTSATTRSVWLRTTTRPTART